MQFSYIMQIFEWCKYCFPFSILYMYLSSLCISWWYVVIEFMCTLCIFELIEGSKDLSYVRKSLISHQEHQDFPWEKILALLFSTSLCCLARIETCKYWLTVLWIWRHFFFLLLLNFAHLKRKQNKTNKKKLLPSCTCIWILYLHSLFYLQYSNNLVKKRKCKQLLWQIFYGNINYRQ